MSNRQPLILIVEDSQDDREMYAHHFFLSGYRVSTAADGEEGVEKAFEVQPDVVLLDLRLPRLGGWEATRILKNDARTKNVPIVIITGSSWIQPRTMACDGWLTKPCPLDQLDGEINRILKTRNPAPGESPPPL